MARQKGHQKGPQQHAEGQHGRKTHERFIEQIHESMDPDEERHANGMARATKPTRTDGTGSAADFLPERRTLPALRRAAAGCRGCHLWKVGTQTVFGEGTRTATVMFVGEQPGDQEDRAGHPFVGPSGRCSMARWSERDWTARDAYVTNAVKHFKWVPDGTGKRRIHKTPNRDGGAGLPSVARRGDRRS